MLPLCVCRGGRLSGIVGVVIWVFLFVLTTTASRVKTWPVKYQHHQQAATTEDCIPYTTLPHNAAGNVSDCRSRGHEFDPDPVPYFCRSD